MASKSKILQLFKHRPVEFLSNMGIDVKSNSTRQLRICCPFHDECNASFSINLEKGLWICFAGCGQGDIFELYRRLKGVDGSFNELLEEMENELC